MFCSKCGSKIVPETSVCRSCGQTVITADPDSAAVENNPKKFITPGAAGIALICFFLPWAKISCMGSEKLITGAQLGGYLWIVFISAAMTLVGWFVFFNQKRLSKAAPLVVGSSIAGLITILVKYIQFTQGIDTGMGSKITPQDVGFSLHIGGYGTVLGLLGALAGTFFQKKKEPGEKHGG